MFNIIGEQIYFGIIVSEKQLIDVHALPIGNYIIHLIDEQGNRITRTVVKQE